MTADEILLDTEERMEKAISVLQARPGRHPHRPGESGPGRFAARRRLRLADADQGDRRRSAPKKRRSSSAPSIPARSKISKRRSRPADLGLNPQNDGRILRITVPPLSTEVRRKLVAGSRN